MAGQKIVEWMQTIGIGWNRYIILVKIGIYTPEKGGRKPAPKAMLMVFFVSALKYLEVKAVASC
jgi:uncharacterized Fe-S cluster-containing radical SAM superfamily enzyme